MRIIGTITREMFYNQNPKFISYTDLQMYEVPQKGFIACDIGRLIYLKSNGEITLEKYSKKTIRDQKALIFENEPAAKPESTH